MMHLFISVLLYVAVVLGDTVEFVSPGPSTSNYNPSVSNAIHPINSSFHVAWSGTNSSKEVSVAVFQYDGEDLVYPFEYVLHATAGVTSTDWTVSTDKNLTYSNLFLFNLFYEGETTPVAVSETFNITNVSSSSTTTSSSISSSTRLDPATSTTLIYSTIAPSSATSTAAAAAAATTTSSRKDAVSEQSGGLTTGTKAGVGVAVPVVALGALAMGYYLFQRRAKKEQRVVAPPVATEQSPMDVEHKPAELIAGTTYEPQMYELHGMSGTPATMYELSGDLTRC